MEKQAPLCGTSDCRLAVARRAPLGGLQCTVAAAIHAQFHTPRLQLGTHLRSSSFLSFSTSAAMLLAVRLVDCCTGCCYCCVIRRPVGVGAGAQQPRAADLVCPPPLIRLFLWSRILLPRDQATAGCLPTIRLLGALCSTW